MYFHSKVRVRGTIEAKATACFSEERVDAPGTTKVLELEMELELELETAMTQMSTRAARQ